MGLWYTAQRLKDDKYEFVICKSNPPDPSQEIINGNDPNGVIDNNYPRRSPQNIATN